MRQILVTSALPYANGPIHLGHLVEYIQTDIWVRAMKAQGHQVTYVCADDAHGTAIMLKAEANGVTPEQQIATVKASHEADFSKFLIGFDNYHSTHSEENRELSELIYRRLNGEGHISTKDVEQLFDPEKGLFLADRFVKGECPECGAQDQYGDNCEVCGTTYNATELKNPYSTLSGATPVLRTSKHYFFNLPEFESFLKQWTKDEGRLQPSVSNKLQEWFEAGLASWDISRDAPYFGFKIPDTPEGEPDKYFYVWLDAPVGYMASFKNLCKQRQGGIMGIMTGANADGVSISSEVTEFFVNNATADSFPVFAFLSAGLVNIFVPSGGGQFAVQGPVMMPAGLALNVSPSVTAMAIAWGDAWTNMIQPFWALPLLGIAGLDARAIMGYCLIILAVSGAITTGGFWLLV